MRVQNQYLKSYKPQSGKFLENAPLAKKSFQINLEQPIQDVLNSMPTKERLTFVRRVIGEALVREGLLELPENNYGVER
jgi:hypothetical protein